MKKYIVEVLMEKHRNAMSKAKADVQKIALECGYTPVQVAQVDNRIKRRLVTRYRISKNFQFLENDDVLLVQYPTYMGRFFENNLINFATKKGTKTIAIIHDIDVLRFGSNGFPTLEEVVSQLNMYDVVIASNIDMAQLLRNSGLNTTVQDLQIFDYLHDIKINEMKKKESILNFAGNLDKSKFLYNFDINQGIKLNLFGSVKDKEKLPANSTYNGSFEPEELPKMFEAGYGLVWDGDSAQRMTGLLGNYQKYNNPHKVSLYLSSGLPVIIWEKAALAKFIIRYNLGITLNSLDEVEARLARVSDQQYAEMVHNCCEVSKRLTEGYYTKHAISNAEKVINAKNRSI
jgi:hypothetical protein